MNIDNFDKTFNNAHGSVMHLVVLFSHILAYSQYFIFESWSINTSSHETCGKRQWRPASI